MIERPTEQSSGRRRLALGIAGQAAPVLAAGLYVGRVWGESVTVARSWVQIASLVLAGVAAAAATLLLRRLRWGTWPLVLLGAYVLWPQADGRVALAAGTVAFVTLALVGGPKVRVAGYVLDLFVAAAALWLYVVTLAPSVQPADAGEFQLVSAVLGIAHPPGYPLYTMLGKLFTLLPFGNVAWRVNLFAAACAAATLAVIARAVRQATNSVVAALLSALVLGLAPTFWSQGTLANIRSLTGLLTSLSIYCLLRYGEGRSGRHLLGFAVSFGLGIGHHSSLALLALPFVAYLLAVDPHLLLQPRRWAVPLAGLGGSLLILLYLPLRSAMTPPFDPAPIRSVNAFLSHILALGFRGDFLYFLTQPTLELRFGLLGDILAIEFGAGLAALATVLGLLAGVSRWRWGVLWMGVAAVNSLAAITYRAPQTVEYLLPTYVALTVGMGLGLGSLRSWSLKGQSGRLPGTATGLLAATIAWLAIANGLASYPSFQTLHRDDSTRQQATALLSAAPPGALVLSNWHQATPLWYLQQVEGLRPDVTVTYVYPEGATPNGQVWARRIGEAVGQRAVLVTNRFPEFAETPYRFVATGPAWTVEAGPGQHVPSGFSGRPQVLADKVEFLGSRAAEGAVSPGQAVEVQVAWQARTPFDRDYSWFVQLVGPGGVAGQSDVTYGVGRVAVGEVVVDSYRFALRPDTGPGEYRLIGGVYITYPDGRWERLRTADGLDAIDLGGVQVRPRPAAPPTMHPLQVTWGDGSRLVGVDYDDSVAGQRRVYLHWYRPAGTGDVDLTLLRDGQAVGRTRLRSVAEAGYQTVACEVSPADTLLRLRVTAGERTVSLLGPWHRAASQEVALPTCAPGARYLDLGGEMVLVHARWRPEVPEPGVTLSAELRFLASRPLAQDYTVSLSLEGDGWRAQHDGTPALGAIPTLKWLAGWQVRDPRLLAVPGEAAGRARLRLTVYDAFTLSPLPVGDDRLARAGQGVQATLWEGVLGQPNARGLARAGWRRYNSGAGLAASEDLQGGRAP